MFHNIGYGRVSKEDTNDLWNAAKNQRSRLERQNCSEILFDIQPGTDDHRPDFEILVNRIKSNSNCDQVTITRLDRITRGSEMTLELLELFRKSKVGLLILEMGEMPVDLNNPYVWKQLAHQGIDNHFYVKLLGINIRRGYEELRAQGKANPKNAWGYKRVKERYVLDEEQAVIIRDLFDKFFETKSVAKVCNHAAEKYSIKLYRAKFCYMIENPIYRGHTRYSTTVRSFQSN